MDKNAIKKYAVWARNELIARVTQKAEQYEITKDKTTPANAESIGGRLLTDAEKKQRTALIEKIKADGFEQVMEEVAYTWFNRFTALRFMEVNNYLPSHTRVFTNESGEFKPQILADAISLELDGLDMDKVYELKDTNKTEELYKYLLIVQCNALSSILPRMFQKIEHYTELLLPDYLLREGSVIEQMIVLIPEEDWTDQVQIIGWLYQYYNSEPKDAVFAALKKNVKISKENIPAATQLFTPDWIVRYMVENSLGRLWLEGHPNDALKSEWKYYLDEAEQEADVQKQLDEIRKEYAELKPEEIRCIDPCMGSGHILCYMFDVLVKIYEDYGYTAREAVGNIVEKNLWGLDIDERAAQLSYFAVMMKARQYDRRFLTRGIQPHVYAIEESNGITSAPMHDMGIELSQEEYGEAAKQAMRLVEEMHDAKEYGSIIHVTSCDWDLLRRFAVPRGVSEGQMRLDIHGEIAASERLQALISIGEALSQKYHAVVTNPPYMGGSGMGGHLSDYVKANYPNSKADLFAVFIEKCNSLTIENYYFSMITQQAWMFLTSYEKLRLKIYSDAIVNMAHLGARAFEEIAGEVVQTTSFVICKSMLKSYISSYARLVDYTNQKSKETAFLKKNELFCVKQDSYSKIQGSPVAYWVSDTVFDSYNNPSLSDYGRPCKGIDTGDNNTFLRMWFEVENEKMFYPKDAPVDDNEILMYKWFPYNKGGEYRKWYGNNEYLLNWGDNGSKLRSFKKSNLRNKDCYLNRGITWSTVTGTQSSMRFFNYGYFFDNGGSCLFAGDHLLYILGYLNSKVARHFLGISPTLNTQPGDIGRLPFVLERSRECEIEEAVKRCIDISKSDWDDYEVSWDFKVNPIVKDALDIKADCSIEHIYEKVSSEHEERFADIKENEQIINNAFIDIFGLQSELNPYVDDKDITIRKADYQRDIKALISYAIGCMFGRYSLEKEGLIYAGGKWNPNQYTMFTVDEDGIIPICDDEYFTDDVVGRFVKFIEVVFGEKYLEENLLFIADALGGRGSSREAIRNYFINDFYSDHLRMYQKRPIYWLFDSGKRNGFKCLVYMHRYKADTIARIRTDYIHEQQSRYRTAIADIEQRISSFSASEKIKLNKELEKFQAQADEIKGYEEHIHHLADQMIVIDLDDGVKANYGKFAKVVAPLK